MARPASEQRRSHMARSPDEDTLGMQRDFLEVDGLKVACVLTGHGPPVLLLHGFGEFIESWAYNIPALSQHFTVVAPDLPGHGQSDPPQQDVTLPYCLRFVIGLMDSLGIERASLVGRSMGGPVCLGLAAEHPGRVNRIVLVSSAGYTSRVPLHYRLAVLPILGDILLGPPALINETTVRLAMKRQFYDPNRLPADWTRIACHYLRMPHRNMTIRSIIRANANLISPRPRADVPHYLPQVKTPILIIHGRQDRLVPAEQANVAVHLMPGAGLLLLDECGHNPQMEHASRFNESVVSFLLEGRLPEGGR